MWYNKVVADLGNIPAFINYYENELVEGKYDCSVKGNLEKSIAGLPGITEHRFNQLQEIEAVYRDPTKANGHQMRGSHEGLTSQALSDVLEDTFS